MMRVYARNMRSLCYCASLRAAARKATALYDHALASVGLNIAQFSLLRRIERFGPLSLTALAQACELDRSTVGRNVRVLERQGWVTQGEAQDLREAVVRLSAAGVDVLRRGAPLWRAAQERVESILGAEGAHGLLALPESL
jgi:DNA-binding MarR family transcriptional regulator